MARKKTTNIKEEGVNEQEATAPVISSEQSVNETEVISEKVTEGSDASEAKSASDSKDAVTDGEVTAPVLDKHQELANVVFKQYPSLSIVYITNDGMPFENELYASSHNSEYKVYNRGK